MKQFFLSQQNISLLKRKRILFLFAILLIAVFVQPRWSVNAASAPLTITLTSQEKLWLDANRCNAQGPRGA
ncbi:hypothetical protein [Flexilinea flocculi]|uniref:hypothetical protein n=1 Tax=Flexilinea flocculi TaxID=1678840 RepID=UPI000782A2A0|nr:hypothetical protein [Flexilinea flocculi]